RDAPRLRRRIVAEVEHDLVDITPSPSLRRVIALDDRMARRAEMFRCMLPNRLVATADMAACPAHPEVEPRLADLQALLAARGAWRNFVNGFQMAAGSGQCIALR